MAPERVYDTYPLIAPQQYAGKLKGKVVIVTGASSGIGRVTCKRFAAAGASVACVARREEQLKNLVGEIESSGGHAIPVVADVATRGAAQEIVGKVVKDLGPVDVLVNNAGIARISPVSEELDDMDLWWRVYEVNVLAPARLIRAVLPSMIERNSGVVMSVSSGVATMALPVMTAYASSKAAISKIHESITVELKDTNVLSFAVNPGMVRTELGAPTDAMNKQAINHPAMQAFLATIDHNAKMGEPELPADTMVALAADEKYKVLNGRHVDADADLVPVLEEAQKEGLGKIGAERLYLVNIRTI